MLSLLFGRSRQLVHQPWQSSADWLTSTDSGYGHRKTKAGPGVDPETALTYGAVWCATRILAETCSSLPLFTYRRLAGDDREHASDLPIYDLLHSRPNPLMGSMAWREGRVAHQANWGNAFSEIQRRDPFDRNSPIEALWPIHACRVRPSNKYDSYTDGSVIPEGYYIVKNDEGPDTAMAPWEMLHVPGVLPDDGIWGKGIITYARETIGLAMATEQHGSRYFSSGGLPVGIAFLPGLKDQEARRTFRKEWKEIHSDPDGMNIAILPPDGKFEQLSMSNEDGQFLESRKMSVSDIARFYRVPAHMLYDLERASYNSIEQMSLEFVIYSILPWLRRWEEQCNLKLLTPAQRKNCFVEHQLGGLLRGDLKSRYEAYSIALQNGFMNRNEVRRLENQNGIGPDGDRFFVPMNMIPLDRVDDALDSNATSTSSPTPPAGAGPGPDEERDTPDGAFMALPIPTPAPSLQLREAASAVLHDALTRMFTKESKAAERAAKRPDFDTHWMEEFYGPHRALMAEALRPSCAVLGAAGVSLSADSLATALCEESRKMLVLAYNHLSREQMAKRLEEWPTVRVGSTVARVLSGELK